MVKRDRDSAAEAADAQIEPPAIAKRQKAAELPASHNDPVRTAGADEDEDEDAPLVGLPRSSSRSQSKKGQECPYLDTISRQVDTRNAAPCSPPACSNAAACILGRPMGWACWWGRGGRRAQQAGRGWCCRCMGRDPARWRGTPRCTAPCNQSLPSSAWRAPPPACRRRTWTLTSRSAAPCR